MKYDQWLKNPIRFLAMTGYRIEQFHFLLPFFEQAHQAHFKVFDLDGKRRTGMRKFVLYANSPLPTIEERLAFILSFLKLNPLQELHADLFGITQKQCSQFTHSLHKILQTALTNAGQMPCQDNETLQKVLAQGKESVLFHDCTELEIPRPQDQEKQTDMYSGKKKKHTIKNAIISTALCVVLYVSPTVSGKTHDKKLTDTAYQIPAGYELWQDTGYQGYAPSGVKIHQPMKKPRGKTLNEEQKEYNRTISKTRVRVEHSIGSIKRYRIVKDECRLRKNNFVNHVFLTCAALHNLRLQLNPCQYPKIN